MVSDIEKHLSFLVEGSKGAQAADIIAAATALDSIIRERGAELDPRLLHYLQGRSYHKALARIRGDQAAPGRCGA